MKQLLVLSLARVFTVAALGWGADTPSPDGLSVKQRWLAPLTLAFPRALIASGPLHFLLSSVIFNKSVFTQ